MASRSSIGRELHALSWTKVRSALVHVLRVHPVRMPVVELVAVHVSVSVRVVVVCHLSQRRSGCVGRDHHAACDRAWAMHGGSKRSARSARTAHEVAPCAHAGTARRTRVMGQGRHAQTAVAAETDVRQDLVDCTAEVLETLLDLAQVNRGDISGARILGAPSEIQAGTHSVLPGSVLRTIIRQGKRQSSNQCNFIGWRLCLLEEIIRPSLKHL